MKKELFVAILLGFSLSCFCQPTIKVFGFEQDNMPGTKPAGVTDENGNYVRKVAAKKNYFIFLSFNKSYDINPTQIFIRGNPLKVKSTSVKRTPVEQLNNNIPNKPEKIVLVPATNNKVLELGLDKQQGAVQKTADIDKLLTKNDVVIVYWWKKKKYTITLKKLKQLQPIFNE